MTRTVCARPLKHRLLLLIPFPSPYLTYPVTMPTYCPCYCESCQTCLQPLFPKVSSICQRCEERERIPWADQTRDRCSTCKRIRPVADFPLHRNGRTSSCAACLTRLRDVYRERKGEPVSKERRVRRFKQAQRVVEKDL